MKHHPNAVVGGLAGSAGGAALIEILDLFGVHVTGGTAVWLAGGLTALALLIGRRGFAGVWQTLKHGTGS